MPPPALYTALSLPFGPSGTVGPFALVSPSGKLIVEVVGVAVGVGVTDA